MFDGSTRTALLCNNPLRATVLKCLLESALGTDDTFICSNLHELTLKTDPDHSSMWVILIDGRGLSDLDWESLCNLHHSSSRFAFIQVVDKSVNSNDVWHAMSTGMSTLPTDLPFVEMRNQIRKRVRLQLKRLDRETR